MKKVENKNRISLRSKIVWALVVILVLFGGYIYLQERGLFGVVRGEFDVERAPIEIPVVELPTQESVYEPIPQLPSSDAPSWGHIVLPPLVPSPDEPLDDESKWVQPIPAGIYEQGGWSIPKELMPEVVAQDMDVQWGIFRLEKNSSVIFVHQKTQRAYKLTMGQPYKMTCEVQDMSGVVGAPLCYNLWTVGMVIFQDPHELGKMRVNYDVTDWKVGW